MFKILMGIAILLNTQWKIELHHFFGLLWWKFLADIGFCIWMCATLARMDVVRFGLWRSRHSVVSASFLLIIKFRSLKILTFNRNLSITEFWIQFYMSRMCIIGIIWQFLTSPLHSFRIIIFNCKLMEFNSNFSYMPMYLNIFWIILFFCHEIGWRWNRVSLGW
jgi:hypothetical protein